MNKYLAIATIAVAALLGGCAEDKLAVIKERKVTLYASDGKIIREWRTHTPVEHSTTGVWIRDNDGQYTVVRGTTVVEFIK